MPNDTGPVQLIVFGFEQPKFGGSIAAELRLLNENNIVRVLDAIVVHKDAHGDIRLLQVTDLDVGDIGTTGSALSKLIGMDGEMPPAPTEGGDEWDVLEEIPNDTAAAMVLLEHRWAIPLSECIRNEGGAALGDVWLRRPDVVALGLAEA